MSKVKMLIDEILNCSICEGSGISNYWTSPDGDYDFEWCDCNPHRLIIDENELISPTERELEDEGIFSTAEAD